MTLGEVKNQFECKMNYLKYSISISVIKINNTIQQALYREKEMDCVAIWIKNKNINLSKEIYGQWRSIIGGKESDSIKAVLKW